MEKAISFGLIQNHQLVFGLQSVFSRRGLQFSRIKIRLNMHLHITLKLTVNVLRSLSLPVLAVVKSRPLLRIECIYYFSSYVRLNNYGESNDKFHHSFVMRWSTYHSVNDVFVYQLYSRVVPRKGLSCRGVIEPETIRKQNQR